MSSIGTTPKVCFIGGARYDFPLNTTDEKKFARLSCLGELFVIGFSKDLLPHAFASGARFYLLPLLPVALLRYVELLCCGTLITLWLVLRHRVRVLIAQSPYEGVGATLAKRVAGSMGRPIVLVVESHGDFENSLFMQRHIIAPDVSRLLMRRAATFALRNADVLRAISKSTRQQLERWVPGKTIYQFPTWTDIDRFLQAGAQPKESDSDIILYSGVVIPRKGLHHLIKAFASIASDCPIAELALIGKEESASYAAELKAQVRALGLGQRVRFEGELSQKDLARRMRGAKLFVLPSLSEGLGRVVVEAMATGTPVIGSHVGGIPEMIRDGVTGFLVPPGGEQELADRIRWILQHPKEAQDMGARARVFAQQFFSTGAYVDGYQRIFEKAQALLSSVTDPHATSAL